MKVLGTGRVLEVERYARPSVGFADGAAHDRLGGFSVPACHRHRRTKILFSGYITEADGQEFIKAFQSLQSMSGALINSKARVVKLLQV